MDIDPIQQLRITRIADKLVSEGIKPTIRKIRELNGGDTNIITKGLRAWRDSQPSVDPDSDTTPIEMAVSKVYDGIAENIKLELDNYCSSLQEQLANATTQLEDAALLIQFQKDEIAEQKVQSSQIKSEHDNAVEDLAESSKALSIAEFKTTNLAETVSMLEAGNKELNIKLDLKDEKINKYNSNITELNREAETTNNSIIEKDKQLAKISADVQTTIDDNATLAEAVDSLKNENQLLKAKVNVMAVEKECLLDQIVDARELSSSLQITIAELQKQMADSSEEHVKLVEKNNENLMQQLSEWLPSAMEKISDDITNKHHTDK